MLGVLVTGESVVGGVQVRIMATRCMMQAVYLGSAEVAPPEYHHYGLAAPLYTHFTSPIRRCAPVIAHHWLMMAGD